MELEMKEAKEYKGSKNILFCAFVLNGLIAVIAILPYIIRGHGAFAMSNDYNAESIPFNMLINLAYKSGEIIWNDGIDLGGNFIETLNGYNSSPFVLLQLPFPYRYVPYILPWILCIKYAVAGLTSCMYLRCFEKDRAVLLIGSILYSFSGYQCTNIIFPTIEFVAFFPLVLYGTEKIIEGKNSLDFAIGIALVTLTGVTNLYMVFVFLLIYCIFRVVIPYLNKDISINIILKILMEMFIGGVIGGLVTSFFSIPAIINLMGNPRASAKISMIDYININTVDVLQFIRSFFFPSEPMSASYSLVSTDWMSNAGYIPMFGISFVLPELIKKDKGWLKKLILFLLICTIIPLLNNSFYCFSVQRYRRWYPMMILVMVLATIKQLQICDKKYIRYIVFCQVVIGIYYFIVSYVDIYSNSTSLVFDQKMFLVNFVCSIASLSMIGMLLYGINSRVKRNRVILFLVSICSIVELFFSVHGYHNVIDNTEIDFNSFGRSYSEAAISYLTEVVDKLDTDIGPYRYYFDESIGYTYYNLGMTKSLSTTNSFISTLSNNIYEFYDSIGVGRWTMTIRGPRGTGELLAEKYIVSTQQLPYNIIKQFENRNGQIFYLYENKDALPIAFTYDSYITKTEFDALDYSLRSCAMIKAMVVEDSDVENVSKVIKHYDSRDDGEINGENIETDVNNRQKDKCRFFDSKGNTISCNITADSKKYAFFSVPYEKWWHAYVNGSEKSIIKVNGLIAVEIDEGANEIELNYDYLPLGIAKKLSAVGGIMVIVLILRRYYKDLARKLTGVLCKRQKEKML